MEQRSDAFKYCHVNQRPFPHISSNGIGPWEVAFELLGIISVATNMALIALHPEVREYLQDYSDIEYFAFFVLLEVFNIFFSRNFLFNKQYKYFFFCFMFCLIKHILILFKVMIMTMIPNESYDIYLAKQKYKYESLEAFKKEVMLYFFKCYFN